MKGQDWIEAIGAVPLGRRAVTVKNRKAELCSPPSRVEHVQFDFRQWDGKITEDFSEHFGKKSKQVYSLDGTDPLRSCAEVEVAKRLREIRDQAFWFSGYSMGQVPEIWRPWVSSLRNGDTPEWLTDVDARIRKRIGSKRGGMPNVVAWNQLEPVRSALFIECKGPGESFGEAQEDWIWAARQVGIRLSQLAVSLRPF
jgi:hypothetical protein